MSRKKAWKVPMGLLLVVSTLGCPVAEEAKQSPKREALGQDAAIAEIEKLGGKVEVDEASSTLTVTLLGTQFTDASLEHVKELANLKSLLLSSDQVTDAGLEHLKGSTSLQTLRLEGTQVTEAGVNDLKKASPHPFFRVHH